MKTVSLELAKQLKEAGYLQESHFAYYIDKYYTNLWEKERYIETDGREVVDAPTADEILDFTRELTDIIYWKDEDKAWVIEIGMFDSAGDEFEDGSPIFKHPSLADASAKMWLYLKKEGLL